MITSQMARRLPPPGWRQPSDMPLYVPRIPAQHPLEFLGRHRPPRSARAIPPRRPAIHSARRRLRSRLRRSSTVGAFTVRAYRPARSAARQCRHMRRSNLASLPPASLARLAVTLSQWISAWTKPHGNGATNAKPNRRRSMRCQPRPSPTDGIGRNMSTRLLTAGDRSPSRARREGQPREWELSPELLRREEWGRQRSNLRTAARRQALSRRNAGCRPSNPRAYRPERPARSGRCPRPRSSHRDCRTEGGASGGVVQGALVPRSQSDPARLRLWT